MPMPQPMPSHILPNNYLHAHALQKDLQKNQGFSLNTVPGTKVMQAEYIAVTENDTNVVKTCSDREGLDLLSSAVLTQLQFY